jgi:hypothetical protein
MNLQVLKHTEKLLSSCTIGSLLRRTQLHGISYIVLFLQSFHVKKGMMISQGAPVESNRANVAGRTTIFVSISAPGLTLTLPYCSVFIPV